MSILKKISICCLVLGFLFSIYPPDLFSYWIWTPETGKWINPKYAAKDTPKEQFDYAMSFFDNADYKAAIKAFKRLVVVYPKSKYAPDAQYYVGRSFEGQNEYYKAFKEYQKVIDKYPYTEKLDEIINKEFEIANMFFEGKKRQIWGVEMSIMLTPEETAIEIFEKVAQNSPYGDDTDQVYYKLGLTYKKIGNFQSARESFNKLLEGFPDSPLYEKAEYQAAYCAYQFSLDPSYDQEATDEAIAEFKAFISKNPDSELSKEAEKGLSELHDKRAKKIFDVAIFYEKQSQNKSAIIYYEEVVKMYPSTKWAAQAMEKITVLKAKE